MIRLGGATAEREMTKVIKLLEEKKQTENDFDRLQFGESQGNIDEVAREVGTPCWLSLWCWNCKKGIQKYS